MRITSLMALLPIALSVLLCACDRQPRHIEIVTYQVEAIGVWHDPQFGGPFETTTEAVIGEPCGPYLNQGDSVLEITFGAGVIGRQPQGVAFPIRRDGDTWSANYTITHRDPLLKTRYAGSGTLSDDDLTGRWETFETTSEDQEHLVYEVQIDSQDGSAKRSTIKNKWSP